MPGGMPCTLDAPDGIALMSLDLIGQKDNPQAVMQVCCKVGHMVSQLWEPVVSKMSGNPCY